MIFLVTIEYANGGRYTSELDYQPLFGSELWGGVVVEIVSMA